MSAIGSIWHKWDLHVHTASSYDSKYNAADHDIKLVSAWVKHGISAAAITDYGVIDEERIANIRKIISDRNLNITVFPGVELRTDTASSNLHVIGIFSEMSDMHALAEDFRAFARRHNLIDNPQTAYVSLPDIVKFVRDEQHGLISVHDGKKSNGLGRATGLSGSKDDPNRDFKTLLRHDFRSQVDFLDTNSEQSAEALVAYICTGDLDGLPVTVNSDIHSPKAYQAEAVTWIKAELTFDGLREAFSQPAGRISFKVIPKELQDQGLRKNSTISEIDVRSDDGKSDWYGNSLQLPLNPGLVTIIGNKGAGKSALADVLGLDGRSRNLNDASFLSKHRFNDKSRYGSRFSSRLRWCDGTEDDWLKLDQKPSSTNGKVEFLPQSYIEKIASSVSDEELSKEIQKIVFEALPKSKRLGQRSWAALIEKLEQKYTTSIQDARTRLQKVNIDILQFESKLKVSYLEERQEKLHTIQAQIKSMESNPPKKPLIENPESDESEKRQSLVDKMKTNKRLKETEEKEQGNISQFILDLNELQNNAGKVVNTINEYNKTVKEFVEKYSTLLPNLTEITELTETMQITANISSNRQSSLSKNQDAAENKKSQLQKAIDETAKEIETSNKEINRRDSKMSIQGKQQAQYHDALEAWNSKLSLLKIGDEGLDTDSEKSVLEEIQNCTEKIPNQIAELYKQRHSLVEQILDLIKEKGRQLDGLYLDAKQYIDVLNNVDQQNGINTERDSGVEFVGSIQPVSGFVQTILSNVDGRKAGKLRGSSEAADFINSELDKTDVSISNQVIDFIEAVLYQNDPKTSRPDFDGLEGIFRDRATAYDYLFGLEFLDAELRLMYNKRPLQALSAGEKGLVLLIFYLGLSRREYPLVIDQPEDNLDNQSIFKHLVPYLRYAKTQRQIIVVTHNPNIAIAADADQVIVATMDKNTNTFGFISGALEDKDINTQIVDVLEGTKPAFDLRDRRYSLFE